MKSLFPLLLIGPLLVAATAAPPTSLRVSSRFGERIDPILGTRAVHRGVDLRSRLGTPVLAAAAGVVRFAGWRGGFGNMIEIDHADGSLTRYAHLSRILVQPGLVVARRETIALVGSTGRSTGSHQHFELWVAGRAVDPLRYLSGGAVAADDTPRHTYSAREPVTEIAAPHRSAFAIARAKALRPTSATALPNGKDVAGGSAP